MNRLSIGAFRQEAKIKRANWRGVWSTFVRRGAQVLGFQCGSSFGSFGVHRQLFVERLSKHIHH